MKMRLPNDVKTILEILQNNGYKGYVVGGCVRDSIIKIKCNDYDITTDASVKEMKNIFKDYHVIETGIKHGTLTVVINGKNYEITTFRTDGKYIDHRHPETVIFTKKLQDDLARRDFTINAMAYNDNEGLIDPFGGKQDLSMGFIKAVGDANIRFQEDALRMMRALRFASVYNFEISFFTSQAIFNNKYLLNYVSKERIVSEFSKILCSKFGADVMIKYRDIFYIIFPCLSQVPYYRYEEKIKQLYKVKNDFVVRMSILFEGIIDNKEFLYMLKLPNDIINSIRTIWHYGNYVIDLDIISLKTIMSLIGADNTKNLLYYQYGLNYFSNEHLQQYLDLITTIKKEKQCYQLKDLAISGVDLMLIGYKGQEVGTALNLALKKVIEGQLPNNKKILISYFSKTN